MDRSTGGGGAPWCRGDAGGYRSLGRNLRMFAGLQVQAAAYEGLFKEVIGLVNMKKFTI